MRSVTRRGALALGMVAATNIARHALAAQNPYEGQTGTLVIRNEVDMAGASEESPAFTFHITVWDYFGDFYMSDDFQLKGGEEKTLVLPAAYDYRITQDQMENYLWSGEDSQEWSWWIPPGGTRYVESRNYRICAELGIHVKFYADCELPFRVIFRDTSGEVWSDDVVEGRYYAGTRACPTGYTYEVEYVGDRYCLLSIEPATGVISQDVVNEVNVTWSPHGHMKVTKGPDE